MKCKKISIVTVCFNSADTIEQTIVSVLNQTYKNIEYIVIDGNSDDGTQEILQKYSKRISKIVIERDNGIYDALNKGVKLCTGEYIGILNSDDIYSGNNILEKIFSKDLCESIIFTNVGIYDKALRKKTRHIKPLKKPERYLKNGHFPPHPGTFLRRINYKKNGLFDTNFKIAADFDLILRNLISPLNSYKIVDILSVKMRIGGVSTSGFKSYQIISSEIYYALKKNGIRPNWLNIHSRVFIKIFEFFRP